MGVHKLINVSIKGHFQKRLYPIKLAVAHFQRDRETLKVTAVNQSFNYHVAKVF